MTTRPTPGTAPGTGLAAATTVPARRPDDAADVARIAVRTASLVPGVSVVRPAAVRLDDRSVGLDLHLITWYGHSVPTIAEAVRTVVADQVAAQTGLTVTVLTVTVDDLLVPGVDGPGGGAVDGPGAGAVDGSEGGAVDGSGTGVLAAEDG
ncbi:cell envelope-related Asp23 family protein [Micromonospora violae]|uniref:Cell envelope-related Asp23 family protein n=1 Tax=Micromonospora violae TaxID=1278207 RepID=A0A4Q7UBI0_9ACTN|nr:Asp23/Gls24 family envelope stress response protein [Micromonospora violae]RZT78475.1 cell envelope-related Asp23 family protein [Micromonospora violae]